MAEPESLGSIIARGKVPGPKKKRHRLEILAVNWTHIVGERMAEHSAPTRLARGALTVAADSPAWAAELSMSTETLLRRIREIMGDEAVRKVRVQSRDKGGPEAMLAPGAGLPDDAGGLLEIDGETAEEIAALDDREMGLALARLVRASKTSKQSEQKGG